MAEFTDDLMAILVDLLRRCSEEDRKKIQRHVEVTVGKGGPSWLHVAPVTPGGPVLELTPEQVAEALRRIAGSQLAEALAPFKSAMAKAEAAAPGLTAGIIVAVLTAMVQRDPKPPSAPVVNVTNQVVVVSAADLSPLARQLRAALEDGPRTADEIAASTKLPLSVVDALLIELRNEGRVEEVAAGLFRAR